MQQGYIYKITNIVNHKWYIGSRRCKSLQEARDDKYMGSSQILKRSIKKYGKENFIKEILCFVDNAYYYENYILEHINAANDEKSYNLKNAGMGAGKGNQINLGKRHSEISKNKMAVSHYNLSDESRKNMSDAQKGKTLSKETRKKLSLIRKGRTSPMLGRIGALNKKSKLIAAYIDGIEVARFFGSCEASRITECSQANIARSCKNKNIKAGAYNLVTHKWVTLKNRWDFQENVHRVKWEYINA